jgi:hypothetical protein
MEPVLGKKIHSRAVAALLWLALAVGLLVQAFGPHLKIHNNAFEIPPSLVAGGKDIHPDELVRSERRIQWFSGTLSLGSAIGLAFYYRRALFGPHRS